jgi:uncharacterized protein YeaO (DUF488 family)
MKVHLKRIYDEPTEEDGFRILVDRLWPRGVSKEKANLDLWLKEIAPSTELRKWFNHDAKKWTGFQRKYKTELSKNLEYVAMLETLIKKNKRVTLLYATRDEEHNEAIVIKNFLSR